MPLTFTAVDVAFAGAAAATPWARKLTVRQVVASNAVHLNESLDFILEWDRPSRFMEFFRPTELTGSIPKPSKLFSGIPRQGSNDLIGDFGSILREALQTVSSGMLGTSTSLNDGFSRQSGSQPTGSLGERIMADAILDPDRE